MSFGGWWTEKAVEEISKPTVAPPLMMDDAIRFTITCGIGFLGALILWTYAMSTFTYATKWVGMYSLVRVIEWYIVDKMKIGMVMSLFTGALNATSYI